MDFSIKWNICRICLQDETSSTEMIPIFENSTLPTEIYNCSGVELKTTDNLPKKICSMCHRTLQFALKFRTTCRRSTEYLRSMLSQAESSIDLQNSSQNEEEEIQFENVDFLDEIPEDNSTENSLEYIIETICEDQQSSEGQVENLKYEEIDETKISEQFVLISNQDIKREVEEIYDDHTEKITFETEPMPELLKVNDTSNGVSDDGIKSPIKQYINTAQQKSLFKFICDVCGNHFQKRSLLNFHMKIHRNEKNYECEICNKRFNSPCNLRVHIRVHTGEKPFQCKYCDRKFADRSTQIKHERIHTNEKPYECLTCGKAFSLSTSLKAHEKMHSGERPYECIQCSKAFTLPHQLKAHLTTNMHKVLAIGQLCKPEIQL